MLLYDQAVENKDDGQYGHLCRSCLDEVNANKTPVLALANNLWAGDVPDELAMLTLPERILVAPSYPAAYIVKLYPKKRGAVHWDTAGLNSGLRGNVSTYRLNTMAIVAMVEGNLLPPKPITLASMLGVSIIGPNNVPEHCMPSFLTVSRSHLRNALLFLKQHNPLYFNITISDENIALFPECGIPDIILSSVRHLHNVEAVDAEQQDYVPEDDVKNVFSAQQVVFPTGHDIQEEIVYDKSIASDIFPVQCHGVLDSAVAGVDDNQVFAHALANTAERYMVRRGNTFVNEYPRQDEDQSLSIGDAENPNHLLGAFPCLFPYAAGGFEVQ
ncbi:hypothetical protein EV702DRAFT_1196809 [Suillus placidus]|uniref:DUF6570 domain-containing protein n=1 Tax=Suillus placidus TaxID=48579 RepID=A0A9P6ZWC1_9AGAM|nr:hypothetical protein EV702DRAFT_1196809 [Suillus placidus]